MSERPRVSDTSMGLHQGGVTLPPTSEDGQREGKHIHLDGHRPRRTNSASTRPVRTTLPLESCMFSHRCCPYASFTREKGQGNVVEQAQEVRSRGARVYNERNGEGAKLPALFCKQGASGQLLNIARDREQRASHHGPAIVDAKHGSGGSYWRSCRWRLHPTECSKPVGRRVSVCAARGIVRCSMERPRTPPRFSSTLLLSSLFLSSLLACRVR